MRGATKKREISRTLLSINLHFSVVVKSVLSIRMKLCKLSDPLRFSIVNKDWGGGSGCTVTKSERHEIEAFKLQYLSDIMTTSGQITRI